MINENWVILGALVQFFGSWPYLRDTLKGIVKPNKVSWLLWSIAPLIAAYAEFKQGVGVLLLTTFVVGFVPVIIFLASFVNKQAEWKITKFDLVCGALSIVGLIMWQITKVGNLAILFSLMADALAAVPTIIKSYQEPETENDTIYWLGVMNAVIGVLAIKTWKFEYYAFPIYLVACSSLIAVLIRFKVGEKFKLQRS